MPSSALRLTPLALVLRPLNPLRMATTPLLVTSSVVCSSSSWAVSLGVAMAVGIAVGWLRGDASTPPAGTREDTVGVVALAVVVAVVAVAFDGGDAVV